LEGFSEQDVERLKKGWVDVRSLFEEDPENVFVRYSWKGFWGL
jgi:hypothetical protein